MQTKDYLKILVEDMHSAVVATMDAQGRVQTRVIDMMLWDEEGVYFLTAKGKAFYEQLLSQQYVALSAVKDKISVSLRGKIRPLGTERLAEIFAHNAYMQKIYPGDTANQALVVFCLYEAEGEYFDITNPAHVVRDSFAIGKQEVALRGYFIGEGCIGCGTCVMFCPQQCIDLTGLTAKIDQKRCLHCGSCVDICPMQAIEKRG